MKFYRKIFAGILSVSLFLLSGCKSEVNNIEDGKEKVVSENSSVISSNPERVNMNFNYSEFSEDDYFYHTSDMKYINNKLYISGYVLSDNNSSPSLIKRESLVNTEEYKLANNEQFFYCNDVIYTFEYDDKDIITTANLLDSNLKKKISLETGQYNIDGIIAVSASDNAVYLLDKESVMHRLTDGFSNHTKKNISDFLKQSYRFTVDDQNNIYVFTSDNEKNELYKLDDEFNLIFKSGNYSDMPGSVLDIFFEKDQLNIQTLDDGYVYSNVIDKLTGETLLRNDVYLYSEKENDDVFDISEDEEYIGKNSDESLIILKYPETKDYYCTLIKDENGSILDEIAFSVEQSKIISLVEISDNGDTVYIEETYDIKNIDNETSETPIHIVHRIAEDGTQMSFTAPAYSREKYPVALKTDSNGNIYIIENIDEKYQICCYNEQGDLKFRTEDCNDILLYINSVIINDELYINYLSNDEKYIINKINTDGHLTEKETNQYFRAVYQGDNQYDLFSTDGKKLYGYNVGSNIFSEILSFINCGIQFTPLDFFEFKNGFVVYDGTKYYYLTEDASSIRQTIKLSGIEISSELKAQVINFNNSNDKYIVECVDYNYNEDSFNKLNLDIITKQTDMVVFNNISPITAENYNSFLFADLSEYVSDTQEMDDNSYFNNVIDLFRSDGKLYTMVTEFDIYALVTRNRNNLNGLCLNLDNFLKENTEINEYRFGFAANILSANINSKDFINNDFRSILKYLKENVNDIAQGSKLNFAFVEFTEENNDEYYGNVITPYFFQTDSSVSYSGLPSSDGIGIVAESIENISIIDNSSNKDGAWEFIRYCLSDDYQNSLYRGIPIKKSAFDKLFKGDNLSKNQCLNIINSADSKYIGDTDLFNIIWEESELYFSDEKTLDDTIKSIQNKTTLYLSETSPVLFREKWITLLKLCILTGGSTVETVAEATINYFRTNYPIRSIRRIDGTSLTSTYQINDNEYRVALRVKNGTGEYSRYWDYHFMIQLSDGSWAHKRGTTNSRNLGYINPSTAVWKIWYDSEVIYFAVTY